MRNNFRVFLSLDVKRLKQGIDFSYNKSIINLESEGNRMNIYVVVDADSHQVYTFLKKENAVKFMFNSCRCWGSVLYAFSNGNYISLGILYKTEEEKLDFLFSCSEDELNDIFESYWVYEETIPEDYNERK